MRVVAYVRKQEPVPFKCLLKTILQNEAQFNRKEKQAQTIDSPTA